MGIIQGCNLCKTPKEVGEINTNGLKDNIKAKQLFETKVKNTKDITIINNNDISKIISSMNAKANNIELPQEILLTKPEKGFRTDLIKFNNDDTYQGYFNEKNQKDGFGIYVKKNGFIYKGLWKEDKIGEYGVFISPEGDYYKGNLVNGEANGEGELMVNNKIKYVGNFSKNLPNQKGTLYNFVDNSIYEGDIVDGKKEGQGILKFNDGTVYEGSFVNDKYEGFGKLLFKNGCKYEGNFSDNMMNGKGKYIYTDGKEYNGDFQMGFKHGFGRLSWNDNKYFEGYWINNKQHGEGTFYIDGKTLKGIFRYGKMIMKID